MVANRGQVIDNNNQFSYFIFSHSLNFKLAANSYMNVFNTISFDNPNKACF